MQEVHRTRATDRTSGRTRVEVRAVGLSLVRADERRPIVATSGFARYCEVEDELGVMRGLAEWGGENEKKKAKKNAA